MGDESKSGAFKDKEGDRRGDAVGGDGGKEGGRREGEVMSPGIVDTLFALLDVNSNGRLDQNEFMTLMKRQSAVPDPVRTNNGKEPRGAHKKKRERSHARRKKGQ